LTPIKEIEMIALEVKNDVLQKAIELRISGCFTAMNIANSLGGSPSDEWSLVRRYSLPEMVADALDRGMPVAEFRAAVTGEKFTDCKLYLKVRDEIGGRPDFPV
jgi:hypothetical protein